MGQAVVGRGDNDGGEEPEERADKEVGGIMHTEVHAGVYLERHPQRHDGEQHARAEPHGYHRQEADGVRRMA